MHYNSNKTAALDSLTKIQALGVEAIAVQSDASTLSFGEDIVEETLKAFPNRKIDILVNNAGVGFFHESVEKSPVEEFDTMFHANVRGPFLLMQAALPHLASPGGRVINISSLVGRIGTKYANLYSASKGAVNAMSIGWAEELGSRGITVNIVSPGPTETDYAGSEDLPLIQRFRSIQNVKRNGTPEEIANVIAFVASAGSSFVTGQLLAVDGGATYP